MKTWCGIYLQLIVQILSKHLRSSAFNHTIIKIKENYGCYLFSSFPIQRLSLYILPWQNHRYQAQRNKVTQCSIDSNYTILIDVNNFLISVDAESWVWRDISTTSHKCLSVLMLCERRGLAIRWNSPECMIIDPRVIVNCEDNSGQLGQAKTRCIILLE